MEGEHSVTPLMIVVITAFVTPIILHRLRLKAIPVVVAEIIVGLILGESGLRVNAKPGYSGFSCRNENGYCKHYHEHHISFGSSNNSYSLAGDFLKIIACGGSSTRN